MIAECDLSFAAHPDSLALSGYFVKMDDVIKLTRINGADILVNPDLVQTVERHGDTVLALTSGDKILVKNSLEDIAEKVTFFRASIIKRSQGPNAI